MQSGAAAVAQLKQWILNYTSHYGIVNSIQRKSNPLMQKVRGVTTSEVPKGKIRPRALTGTAPAVKNVLITVQHSRLLYLDSDSSFLGHLF